MEGKRLKLERARAGLTLKQLAEKAELTLVQISNIENNKIKKPFARTLFRLAVALQLPDDFFMEE